MSEEKAPAAAPSTPPRGLGVAAVGVFLVVFAAMAATAGDLGLTWDEPAYLHSARGNEQSGGENDPSKARSRAADRHANCGMLKWFGKLTQARSWQAATAVLSQRSILEAWDYNRYGPNFHPPLSGMLASLGYAAAGRRMDEIAAWRLASGAEFALAVAVLFLFLARRYGPWVGGVAAGALVLMPRVVGDGHIFGTDMPMMTMWALTALAFWKGLESRLWRILFGVLLGLCFVTKFSAMLVIVPLGAWLFCYRVAPSLNKARVVTAVLATVVVGWPLALGGYEVWRLADLIRLETQRHMLDDRAGYIAYVDVQQLGVTSRFAGWLLVLPLPLWLVWSAASAWSRLREWVGPGLQLWLAGLAIAPAVAISANPTWWHETLPQLTHYYQISVGRQTSLPDIEIFYLGKKYIYSLPWHNGWVLTAVTVPTAILVLAAVGLGTAVRDRRRDPLRVFFVLNMITLPVIRMLPTPAHDGVRLMLPTFFFLAALAGWGFGVIEPLVNRFRTEQHSTAPVLGVIAAIFLGPPAYWLYQAHPYELSYYNGLAGGLPGAQRRGFEPTYWYDAVTPEVVSELNDPERGLPRGAVLGLPDPKINPEVFYVLQEMGKLRPDISFSAATGDDFPYIPLLTHSSKATPYTRLMYALKPKAAWSHDGVRLFSLYDPASVARAWALWVLLDASEHSRTGLIPRADQAMISLASRNYRAFYAAAVRVAQEGIDKALASNEDAETMSVIRKLANRRDAVESLLARRKDALVEAAEVINHTAERSPDLLRRIIEFEGYLPADELGNYLDEPIAVSAP
ncbi:MAG: glycosyltransferase family 39 protein [Planctomycetes bacterium]|nr:glycosyltransferase family 39 protein [Planctomycetota bacterium]